MHCMNYKKLYKRKENKLFWFPKVIIEKIWEMDYLSPDVEKTDEELKEQAKTK